MPLRWQGWVVLVGYIIALTSAAPLLKRGIPAFFGYCALVTGVLLAICFWKGEAPRWRWGRDE